MGLHDALSTVPIQHFLRRCERHSPSAMNGQLQHKLAMPKSYDSGRCHKICASHDSELRQSGSYHEPSSANVRNSSPIVISKATANVLEQMVLVILYAPPAIAYLTALRSLEYKEFSRSAQTMGCGFTSEFFILRHRQEMRKSGGSGRNKFSHPLTCLYTVLFIGVYSSPAHPSSSNFNPTFALFAP